MTRNRFFCYIVVACTLVFSLTGCGSKYAAATPAPASDTETETSTEEFEPFDGEGAVQGGIKSDEEIAALQKEEQQYASEAASEEEPAEFVDNTGHEPESYGSGNFQDYWQGDDYFDLVAYMTDNGYEWHMAYDSAYNHLEDGETAVFYEFRNEDTHQWTVVVSKTSDIQVVFEGFKPTYYLVADDAHQIRIDDTGMTISEDEIISLNTIVQAISVNYNEPDPLKDTGLNYNIMQ